jgi:hypothetical protein
MRRTLKTRADLMPLVETLWLVDEQWRPVAASDATMLPPASVLTVDPAGLGADTMVIGRPWSEHGTAPRVMLALRFDAPAEDSKGWIVAAVPESALLGSFGTGAPFADVRMAIYRNDGVRLAGELESSYGARAAGTGKALPLEALRGAELMRFPDGSKRLVGLHDAPRYDVSVVLTRDLRRVLEAWRYTVLLTVAGLVVLLAIILGAVLLLRRADRRRRVAQAALQTQLGARAGSNRWARWQAASRTTSTTCSARSSASARWRATPHRTAARRRASSIACCRQRCAARPWSSASSSSAAGARATRWCSRSHRSSTRC